MPKYEVKNTLAATSLGTVWAKNKNDALDKMAQRMGCDDWEHYVIYKFRGLEFEPNIVEVSKVMQVNKITGTEAEQPLTEAERKAVAEYMDVTANQVKEDVNLAVYIAERSRGRVVHSYVPWSVIRYILVEF